MSRDPIEELEKIYSAVQVLGPNPCMLADIKMLLAAHADLRTRLQAADGEIMQLKAALAEIATGAGGWRIGML